jgi:GNAT superfamily N-acetyltransferase
MSILEIRTYEAQDRAEVIILHKKALASTGADLGDGPWDDDLKDIPSAYAGGVFLVGLVHEKLVAMGAIKYDIKSNTYEVKRMRVDPEYQRRGFGQAILTELELWARENNVSELNLDTTEMQTAARGLYEKNEYREVSRGDIHGMPSIFYKKNLVDSYT